MEFVRCYPGDQTLAAAVKRQRVPKRQQKVQPARSSKREVAEIAMHAQGDGATEKGVQNERADDGLTAGERNCEYQDNKMSRDVPRQRRVGQRLFDVRWVSDR